jgi:hypothetical protein
MSWVKTRETNLGTQRQLYKEHLLQDNYISKLYFHHLDQGHANQGSPILLFLYYINFKTPEKCSNVFSKGNVRSLFQVTFAGVNIYSIVSVQHCYRNAARRNTFNP